jgi:ABC-2 type transport system ATP-binding protein
VEDLKEKYVLVKGDAQYADAAAPYMYSMSRNSYGFEGICLAENLERLAGCDLTREIPTLFQISVAVMKANTVMGQ